LTEGVKEIKVGFSPFVMGKAQAVGSQKADRGLAFGEHLSPYAGQLEW
jgi:hypothetical protein